MLSDSKPVKPMPVPEPTPSSLEPPVIVTKFLDFVNFLNCHGKLFFHIQISYYTTWVKSLQMIALIFPLPGASGARHRCGA